MELEQFPSTLVFNVKLDAFPEYVFLIQTMISQTE